MRTLWISPKTSQPGVMIWFLRYLALVQTWHQCALVFQYFIGAVSDSMSVCIIAPVRVSGFNVRSSQRRLCFLPRLQFLAFRLALPFRSSSSRSFLLASTSWASRYAEELTLDQLSTLLPEQLTDRRSRFSLLFAVAHAAHTAVTAAAPIRGAARISCACVISEMPRSLNYKRHASTVKKIHECLCARWQYFCLSGVQSSKYDSGYCSVRRRSE